MAERISPGDTNCAGRHVCDPPRYPDALGESWDCPTCGAHHVAFDVVESYQGKPWAERMLQRVTPGTLGWRTSY